MCSTAPAPAGNADEAAARSNGGCRGKNPGFQGDDGVPKPRRRLGARRGLSDDEEVPPETRRRTEKETEKKQGWDSKTTKCWIYVTGLPPDVSTDELAEPPGSAARSPG